MCKYIYRYLDDEDKALFFKEYLALKKMIQNFLDDVGETIKNLDSKTIKEDHEIITKTAKTYAQAIQYLHEIDELIVSTFLD